MNQVVRGLNAKVDFNEEDHLVEVDATGDITEEAPLQICQQDARIYRCLGANPCPCRPCQGIHARWLYDW